MLHWRKLIVLTILICSIGMTSAQATPVLDVTEFTLENGLEVILVKDDSAPTVAVNIIYHVGGANDPEGRSGFAHLFEHLMFEETAHLETGELDSLVESAGGYTNAYTSNERTVYYAALPSNQLPLALWFEADRLASLVINEENFENQRNVVIEEYNQGVGNAPYGEAFEDLISLPYTFDPYRQRVIGSVSDLEAATIEDVIAFHDTYYVPNNATLVVAGDIDVEQTRSLVTEYFAPIPAGEAVTPLTLEGETTPVAVRKEIGDPQASVSALLIGYPVVGRADDDFAALEVVSRILGYGASSRLTQALMDTGLSVYTDSFTIGQTQESLLVSRVFANMGVTLEEVEQVYLDEVARIVSEGVTPDELAKTVNQIRSERVVGLETVESLAESVQVANLYFDDPQAVFGEIDRFSAVTVEDVQRVAAQYLTPERATVLLVEPGDAAASAEPVTSETVETTAEPLTSAPAPSFVIAQDTPPTPLPAREFKLPEITETTLDNGLTVIVIPRPEVAIISVDLIMPGGSSIASAELASVTDMASGLLTRGTESRSAQEIASEIEQVGGFLGASTDNDRLTAGVFALREDAELAVNLLADIVLHPSFPESEIELYREQLLTDLQFEFDDPAALAARTFNRLVYGEHPYGATITEASISAVTRDDIVAYYTTQANPETAFAVVTGAVTTDEAVALITDAFGEWQATGDAAPLDLPMAASSVEPGIYLVDRPGSTQAEFLIGKLNFAGADEDRFAGRVMNQIFGGTFTSRLSSVIREEKGYTYGIYSYFTLPVGEGTFAISSAVGNEVAGPALEEILNQISIIRDEPVTEDELTGIVNGLVGSEALRFETYQSLADQVASLRLRGLPIEELATVSGRYLAVDAAQVQAMAQQIIDPENLLIVVVGDASVLEPMLAEIAPVTIIEAE